jgi:hypothetical protein
MLKKIYPLFLVPCFLALCLFFIASCGGEEKEDPDKNEPIGPIACSFTHPAVLQEDEYIRFDDLKIKEDANHILKVTGTVKNTCPSNYSFCYFDIDSIRIGMRYDNEEVCETFPIELKDKAWSRNYSLEGSDEKNQGNGLDMKECSSPSGVSLPSGDYWIYVYVYFDKKLAGLDSVKYTKPEGIDKCASYPLTVNISPAGSGQVSQNPPPGVDNKYLKDASVALTANAANNYMFYAWEEGGVTLTKDNTYTIIISSAKTITAKFISNHSLTPVALYPNPEYPEYLSGGSFNLGSTTIELIGGGGAGGSGTFRFRVSSGVEIIDDFEKTDGSYGKIYLTTPGYDNPDNLRAGKFIPAPPDPSDDTPLEKFISEGKYFVIKSGSSWYLLLVETATPSGSPKAKVKAWQAQ